MSMNKYDFPMVMVGNDSDLPNRQVNYEEAKAFADSYGLSFYEVSINSGLGIEPMFLDHGEQVVFKNLEIMGIIITKIIKVLLSEIIQ